LERTNDRLAFEKRLKIYLNGPAGEENLKGELSERSDQLTSLLNENKSLIQVVEEKNKVI
jgi:hypothetical protein